MIALGEARAGNWMAVEEDLGRVVEAAGGTPVKAILESALLSPSELEHACRVALRSGARFVKTSTGFHAAGGATVAAVAAMRHVVGTAMGVKASGEFGKRRMLSKCWRPAPIGSAARPRQAGLALWGLAHHHSPSSWPGQELFRFNRYATARGPIGMVVAGSTTTSRPITLASTSAFWLPPQHSSDKSASA